MGDMMAPKSGVKSSGSPPGGWLQYKSQTSSMSADGTWTKINHETTVKCLSTLVSVISGRFYHTEVCSGFGLN